MAQDMKQIRIVIAAGGTGGDLFPGIAVAEEIKRSHPGAEVVFAGGRFGLESRLLPELGFAFVSLGSRSISRAGSMLWFITLASFPIGVVRSVAFLVRCRPELVICVGGYASAPLAAAAWLMRLPRVVIEPNAIAGRINRVTGRIASRVFVSFPEAEMCFPSHKTLLTGNPVRREVVEVRSRKKGGCGRMTIFVFGGSQGARRINQAMLGALGALRDLKDGLRMIHQSGRNDDWRTIERAYAGCGFDACVFEFADRIWEHYAEADIVISRAGGTTVAELKAAGVPAILVPYPHAPGDHQRANALSLVRLGAALMIDDADCTGERIAREIRSLIEEPARLTAMRDAISRAWRPGAAQKIVEECWKLIST